MTQILVAGEALVDFIPETEGPLPTVETFHRRAGGAPANVAVGLARLGTSPLLWTRVGDDPFGEFLCETLTDNGVDDRYVMRDPDAKTSLVFVGLDSDAVSSFSFHRDDTADTRMEPGTIPDGTLSTVNWVHAGGVTLTSGSSREATFELLERAGSREDVVVSFDPNARPELFEGHELGASFERAFRSAGVVKTTVEDLQVAGLVPSETTNDDAAVVAETVCEYGPHTALVTRGADGSLVRAEPEAPWNPTNDPLVVEHPGYSVDAVDTTGAGDAFTAGSIAALSGAIGPNAESRTTNDGTGGVGVEDEPHDRLRETLAFANAVAARSTTGRGAMSSLPTRAAVGSFRDRASR
ncbi:carbohydrate kinase family protein [Halorubrum vacuolatum]|uniref:Fructokinase n=1 Tax=Halorubrum vacuolatum TaxID=63740 RepID=A0A238WYB1_HALVU|nr:carbohydrate kinase [Halorubrum vacuolatum]SNR51194.1 fructokinase [Halorubrum vacuolatum]